MRKTMQAMVKILRYRPKPIVPPESTDIDRIHDEIAHAHWGWGT